MTGLKLLPLGGLGEIGMNCLVMEWEGQAVLMDCGIQFPDSRFPGVDLLTPDFSQFLARGVEVLGVVVTHGHDDHIGAIPFLNKHIPLRVYCTPFPKGLIQHKLSEHSGLKGVEFFDVVPHKRFTLGPFTFEPLPVQHSIIESVGFGIETPVGNVIHTGDFKHDASDVAGPVNNFDAFEAWGRKGVHLLLSDSTNAERAGHTISEADVERSFEGILAKQTGRLLIALFASNVRRIENLLHLAHRMGKRVALEGRSMHAYIQLAHAQGAIKIPENTLVLLEKMDQHRDRDLIVLLTGSQAEPQSALVRIAYGLHKTLKIQPTDRVLLSSRFIPGNERAITAMINQLYRQGAEVAYESIHQIHVSGHGFQDELLMMLKATRPKFFIPVHGEYRHLAMHARLAKSAGVAEGNTVVVEDGQEVVVTKTEMKIGEKLALQKGVVVAGSFMSGDPALFSQRLGLAKAGIAFVAVLRDAKTKKLVQTPRVGATGILVPEGETPEAFLTELEDVLEDDFDELRKEPVLEEALRTQVRREFKRRNLLKPAVVCLVFDI